MRVSYSPWPMCRRLVPIVVLVLGGCGGGDGPEDLGASRESLTAADSRPVADRVEIPLPGSVPRSPLTRQVAGAVLRAVVNVPSQGSGLSIEEALTLAGRIMEISDAPFEYSEFLTLYLTDGGMQAPPQVAPSTCSFNGFPNGNSQVTRDDADHNGRVTRGDRMDITARECSFFWSGNGWLLDGVASIEVLEVSGDALYGTWANANWRLRTRQTHNRFLMESGAQKGHATGILETDDSRLGHSYEFSDWTMVSYRLSPQAITVKSGKITWDYPTGRSYRMAFKDVVVETRLPVGDQRNVRAVVTTPQPLLVERGSVERAIGSIVIQTDSSTITLAGLGQDGPLFRLDLDQDNDGRVDATRFAGRVDLMMASKLFVPF